MSTPSARDLEERFLSKRPRDLSHQALSGVREYSKRMFGNRDRLEVAVAISRVALGKVNATDLHRDVDIAVNRIRTQLLALEILGLLRKTGNDHNKRMFEVNDPEDRFWKFAVDEFEMLARENEDPPRNSTSDLSAGSPEPPSSPRAAEISKEAERN